MLKTRTIVSGTIALAHILVMPFVEKGMKKNEAIFVGDWWVVFLIVIIFSSIFAVMILTAEEKKIKPFSFLNTFAGVLIGCWFVFILTNNLTNLEHNLQKALIISFGYFVGLLFIGFLLGRLIDKMLGRSSI